jgi:hypothetical protein
VSVAEELAPSDADDLLDGPLVRELGTRGLLPELLADHAADLAAKRFDEVALCAAETPNRSRRRGGARRWEAVPVVQGADDWPSRSPREDIGLERRECTKLPRQRENPLAHRHRRQDPLDELHRAHRTQTVA